MKTLVMLIPSLLLGQALSIDCGSPSDQFFSCSPPSCDKFTISTPGATGDLTLRYGAPKYAIPAAPGAYDVTLYMRETGTVTGPGQRSFNVSINGQPVLVNFDLFADVGLAPVQKTFQATSAGFIGIDFSYNVIPGQVVRGAVVSRIDVTPKPQSLTYPRQVSETVPLADTIPETQDRLPFLLSNTPTPGSQLIAILQSSRFGNDKMVVRPVDSVKPKEIEFSLPLYRPFSGDVVQVLYWTLEP